MSKPLAVESNKLDHKGQDIGRQAAWAFGARIRERAAELGLNAAELGRKSGIKKQSMTGYWAGDRICGADKLFALADALDVNARWLVSGDVPTTPLLGLTDASAVDWVKLPRYDLAQLTDESKGDPVDVVPFRRDWLFHQLHETNGLWLTSLPGGNSGLGLQAGDLVICSDVIPGEGPYQEWVCIWRSHGESFVAQYSSSWDRREGELDATMIAEGELHAVGRVRAKLLAPVVGRSWSVLRK